jgi:hypothetical protein
MQIQALNQRFQLAVVLSPTGAGARSHAGRGSGEAMEPPLTLFYRACLLDLSTRQKLGTVVPEDPAEVAKPIPREI